MESLKQCLEHRAKSDLKSRSAFETLLEFYDLIAEVAFQIALA
ncbi:hypothetical protein SBC1_08990 [Caballeronia sp. SBC1]|nr:hypothetical protein SBC1_08990 [Caballeronia sp. SBC1]